jgi:hypothetical protein
MSDGGEPDIPPAGEQIHASAPSWLPVLLAVGLTLALIGVTLNLVLTVVGLVLAIPVIVIWIRSAHRDIENLRPGR